MMRLIGSSITLTTLLVTEGIAWETEIPYPLDSFIPQAVMVTSREHQNEEFVVGLPLELSQARSIYLKIEFDPGPHNWRAIHVYGIDGVLQETIEADQVDDNITEIWTSEIFSDGYQIAMEKNPTSNAEINVTGYITTSEFLMPNAVSGVPSFEPMTALSEGPFEPFLSRIASIIIDPNELDIMGVVPKRAARCTGTVIGPNQLLTAGHCFDYEEAFCAGTVAVFGFYHGSATPPTVRRCESIEYIGHSLDIAVLKLEGPPLDGPFPSFPDIAPAREADLAILQHPEGIQARVVRDQSCKITSASAKLYPSSINVDFETTKTGGFTHGCDTLRGSSGAPVFLEDSLEIAGIQHGGRERDGVNIAIRGDLIGYCLGFVSPGNFDTRPNVRECR